MNKKEVVYFMIGAALEQEEEDDDDDDDDDMNHSGIDYLGGSGMKRNVFEKYEQEQGTYANTFSNARDI